MLDDDVTGYEDLSHVNVYDRKYTTAGGDATCNVMLIRWVREEYAERIAVGQIHEDAWTMAWPVVRRIVLG